MHLWSLEKTDSIAFRDLKETILIHRHSLETPLKLSYRFCLHTNHTPKPIRGKLNHCPIVRGLP